VRRPEPPRPGRRTLVLTAIWKPETAWKFPLVTNRHGMYRPGVVTGGWRIAIDFGTSATVAAVEVGAAPAQLLHLEQDSNRMPSAAFLEKDGQLAVGRRAVNLAMTSPGRFRATPKRDMGQESVPLAGTRVRVEDIVAEIFARVLVEAFRQRGAQPPDAVVLTHPVRWGPEKTGQLRSAFAVAAASLPVRIRDAGLPEPVRAAAGALPEPVLVPEPVAAAWHYASEHQLPAGASLAVYDLGGGTFDTAVVEHSGAARFTVRSDGGLADLGGEDFDAALFGFLGGEQLAASHPDRWERILTGEDQAGMYDRRRLLEYARMAKEELSTRTHVECRLLDDPLVEVVLRRDELDAVIEPDLRRSFDAMADTLQEAGLTDGPPAAIYLVGGSSRIPLVFALMQEQFGVEPTPLNDPKAVVALGALTASRYSPEPDTGDETENDTGHDTKDETGEDGSGQTSEPDAETPVGLDDHGSAVRRARKLFAERAKQAQEFQSRRAKAFAATAGPTARRTVQRVAGQVQGVGGRVQDFRSQHSRTAKAPGVATTEATGRVPVERLAEIPFAQPKASWLVFSPGLSRFAVPVPRPQEFLPPSVLEIYDRSGTRVSFVREPTIQGIRAAAFSPHGRRIATTAHTGLRVWDAASGQRLLDVPHPRTAKGVAFSPDGTLLGAVAGNHALAFDAATGRQLMQANLDPVDSAGAMAFGPGGRLAVCGSRTIYIWDTHSGERVFVRPFPSTGPVIKAVAFSPDGQQVAVSMSRYTVIVPTAGGEGWHIPQTTLAAGPLSFSADGRMLAIIVGGTVQIWDLAAHADLAFITARDARQRPAVTQGAAFSANTADGALLATAALGRACVWRLGS
jgi:Hsp70 protein